MKIICGFLGLLSISAAVNPLVKRQGVYDVIPKPGTVEGAITSVPNTFALTVKLVGDSTGNLVKRNNNEGCIDCVVLCPKCPKECRIECKDDEADCKKKKDECTKAQKKECNKCIPKNTQCCDTVLVLEQVDTCQQVNQINDGQIQIQRCIPQPKPAAPKPRPVVVVTKPQPKPEPKPKPQPQPKVIQVNQIPDGQIQLQCDPNPCCNPKEKANCCQKVVSPSCDPKKVVQVNQIPDGQIQLQCDPGPCCDSKEKANCCVKLVASSCKAKRDLSNQHPEEAMKSEKVKKAKTACEQPGMLSVGLKDGILLDSYGRTGYIASNRQFQFDKPAQAGAIYTAGWSLLPDGRLALGGGDEATIFYQCLSGTFYNLYDETLGSHCQQVHLQKIDC